MNDSQKNKTNYLNALEGLVIHDRIVEEIGGIHGVRDENLLHSAVMRPQIAFGGNDMYPDIWHKAAILMEGIAVFHPFSDGNKRTSITATSAFLFRNRFEITLPIQATEDFVLKVAQKQLTIEEIASWLEAHATKILP